MMLQMFKRTASIFLAVLMVFSGMPVAAIAQSVSNASAGASLTALAGTQITRLVLDPRSTVISLGDSRSFGAMLTGGANAVVTDECEWKSADERIATVDKGEVKGVAAGSTQIHCSYTKGEDTWTSYANVTVTEVEYKLMYDSNYPEDAKKYVYENGNTAFVAAASDTHVTYSYHPDTQAEILGGIFSTINYSFTGYQIEGDSSGTLYQPGETVYIRKDTKLIAQWEENGSSTKTQSVQVRYHYQDAEDSDYLAKNAQAVVTVNSENEKEAAVTFITANAQDSIAESNGGSKYYAWRIGDKAYDFNTQATVTATKDENDCWIVNAYPVTKQEDVEGVYAQFFVRRRGIDAEAGDAIGNYHSVGIGLIDMDKLKEANPKWDEVYRRGTYAGSDGMTQDVGGYILEAPSAAHIADLMNVTLREGESVKWYVVKYENNGWHVDGLLHQADKYHRVEFVDPLDDNRLVKTVFVKDSDSFPNADSPENTPTAAGDKDLAFQGWSLTPYGGVLPDISGALGAITQDKVLYARYSLKVNYRSDDEKMGKVSLPSESVGYGNDAEGAEAQPVPGYRFVKWVKEGETGILSEDTEYGPQNVRRTATYVAYFERDFSAFTVKPYEGVYDAGTHGVTVEGIIEGDTVEYALSDDAGAKWSGTPPVYRDVLIDGGRVSRYPVYVRVKNGDSVSEAAQSYVQINPRPVTVTVNSATYDYDGSPKTVETDGRTYAVSGAGKDTGLVEGDAEALSVLYGDDRAQSKTFAGRYAATAPDGAAGVKILNGSKEDVTANYVVTLVPGLLTITDQTAPGSVVTKTHDLAHGEYKLGETVTFTIEATNIYGQSKTITLTELEGVTLGQSVFEDVQPGETVTTTATYTVTEADILSGGFTNRISAKFDGVDEPFENTDVVDPEQPAPHLTVVKTARMPENRAFYTLGEIIPYEIAVTNDGNLTVRQIDVTDSLSADPVIATIDSLAPGESRVFEFDYVVTAGDIAAGKVTNVASAEAANPAPNPDDPDAPWITPGEVQTPVGQLRLTVNYWYDRVGGAAAAGSYTGMYGYGQGYHVASPRISGYSASLMDVTGVITQDTAVDVVYTRNTYTLTVQYRYMDGTVAAADVFAERLAYGDAYDVASPAIGGYVANQQSVSGVMPEGNVVLTVYYAAVPPAPAAPAAPTAPAEPAGQDEQARRARVFAQINEYGIPLGLGSVVMNTGDCLE